MHRKEQALSWATLWDSPPVFGVSRPRAIYVISSYIWFRIEAMDSLAEKIIVENEGNKRINGHTPEYVSSRMGIPTEELFPPGKRTVYIGDPWQKLDLPGVTIVDYEYGPVVEFNETKSELESKLSTDYRRAYSGWEDEEEYRVHYEGFLDENFERVKSLLEKVKQSPIEELPEIAKEFDRLRVDVENELGKFGEDLDGEDMSDEEERIRSLWYLAVEGGRSRDVYDYKFLIEPKLGSYVTAIPENISEDERQQLEEMKKRELVESIRLQKTTKESDVIQAMFPFLPFDDESFDSLVAFYSISTYVFSALERDDFEKYWAEIDRVLKHGGKAYIGPLWTGNSDDFYASLDDYVSKHSWISSSEEESPYVKPIYGQSILTISKKDYDSVDDTLEGEDEYHEKIKGARLRNVDEQTLEY